MKKDLVQLTVRSHPENLKQIRTLIKDTVGSRSVSEQLTGSIILAVDEVCSNIIRHGYNNDTEKQIHLALSASADQLVIEITDRGICFDITRAAPRDPADIKPGGLGVYIIKQVMDHVEYCQTKDGFNQTRLIKKL